MENIVTRRDTMRVSVIMPVYNSEKYVRTAVDSILRQSEKDIQVILVDDGSQDQSGVICDEIAREDKRVLVIHKKNGGICAARNAALDVAEGEYIAFCDNDDEFLDGLIADNYALAKKHDADIVRFCRRRIMTREGRIIRDSVMSDFPFLIIERKNYPLYEDQITNTGNGVWTGLYRRSFIEQNHIRFDESMHFGCEDLMFNIKAYQAFEKMVLNPKVYYVWKNRMEHSTTGKYNINFIESLEKAMNEEINLAKKYGNRTISTGSYHTKLVKNYVYWLYNYLNLAKDMLNISEKRRIIKQFRTHQAFDVKNNYKSIRQQGVFYVVLWTMFYYKWYLSPYCAIHLKQKIFNS